MVVDKGPDYKMFNCSVKKSNLSCSAIEKKELMKKSVNFNSSKRWVQNIRLPQNTDPKSIVVKVQGSSG